MLNLDFAPVRSSEEGIAPPRDAVGAHVSSGTTLSFDLAKKGTPIMTVESGCLRRARGAA